MRSSLTHRSPSIIAALITTSTALAHAAPNYDDHILPIFEQSCNNCHNPDKQKGDLDLTTYTALMRGGSGGKIAEPGEGADSKLYGVITHTLKPKMPPKGEKLSKKDADTIRAWIDGGLLENKSGKPKKKKKAAFSLPSGTGSAKPDGPPPLPRHALLEPVVHTPRASAVADMAASPWAPLLAVTGQRQVLLYHTDTLQLIGIFPFPAGQPETLSFHPSGKYLLAGGGIGGKSGTTITWEVETGKIILTAGKDFDSCIAASLRSDLGGVSFGGPGKRVKLWDTSSDEQLLSIKKHTDWVTQLKYSPDGVLLASGGRGSGVYIWEAETGNPFHTLRAHQGSITEMAWRSDSNLLATASEDGSVLVWEMNNGKQVKKITAHGGGVLSLDWNKNGKGPGGGHLVTSGRDGRVKLWKPNFSLLKELPKFPAMITEVALSQDGKRVFAADWSGAITVWDVATAKQIGTLAANPPTIAQRIEWTRKEIATAPAKLNKAQATAKAAAAQMTAAKTAKETTEKEYHKCKSSSAKLLADRTRLDAQLKTLNAQGQELQKRRIPIQAALTQAREALKKHTAAIRSTEQQKRQTENEIKQLTAKEKQLAERVKKTSEEAAKKPEDPALQ
ncbi:MAG: c-type cytochrome domain-containing protein, partial [Akkermansiaceae bacterium]